MLCFILVCTAVGFSQSRTDEYQKYRCEEESDIILLQALEDYIEWCNEVVVTAKTEVEDGGTVIRIETKTVRDVEPTLRGFAEWLRDRPTGVMNVDSTWTITAPPIEPLR